MKKISLQWRLTIITTLFIAAICGCLTMFVYQNGVYYIDSLQNAVDSKIDDGSGKIQMNFISVFLMKNGMISLTTFLFRLATIK